MAELHEALKYLGPADWSTIPTSGNELDTYLTDLFAHAQTVIDSVPIPSPDDAPLQSRFSGHATKASEVTLSSERSAIPPFGHEKLQKEWGKPMKIRPAENQLGLSVYKMSSKDSKGSWFARRSVHEGIGYTRFKKSLQMEFEKSLAEPGPPGTGNVRGIGGEERVEQIKTDKGNVEVYRLSAQFPGPTAARDFVTMLTTSETALQTDNGAHPPRHYMIISKPCDHPKTQPRNGFVRGFYESVEFVREVPRRLKTSQSSIDVSSKQVHTPPAAASSDSQGRKRAVTIGQPSHQIAAGRPDPSDPEDNPVEWTMITRSDPGGGIPRFLVERGTPGSICADAVKFVDWACSSLPNGEAQEAGADSDPSRPVQDRRGSHQSWKGRSLVGIAENEGADTRSSEDVPEPQATPEQQPDAAVNQDLFNSVVRATASLRPYTPQAILNRLPVGADAQSTNDAQDKSLEASTATIPPATMDNDTKSIESTSSFASAEDHWSSEEVDAEAASLNSSHSAKIDNSQHEKGLRKLDDRKAALQKKFADTQSKYNESRAKEAEQSATQTAKTIEKYQKELKKQEEKYQKEVRKIEERQEKERKKAAEKLKKELDKDDKYRLTRERDEARAELALIKKEAESLRTIVADLQRENTTLAMKLGKAGLPFDKESLTGGSGTRSRGSSLSRRDKKKEDGMPTAGSTAASLKSNRSGGS